MRGIVAFLIACALGACGQPAQQASAQAASAGAPAAFTLPERPPELLASMPQATYVEAVRAAATQDFTRAYGACATVTLRPVRFDRYLDIVDPMDPMAQGIGPAASALVWREQIEVSGCGHTSTRNIIAALQPGTPEPVTAPSMPGQTRVSHGVMRMIMVGVAGAAATAVTCPPDQTDFAMIDTRVTRAPPQPGDWTSPWEEEWTVRSCGQFVRLTMLFAPTPETGGYGYTLRNPVAVGPAPAPG